MQAKFVGASNPWRDRLTLVARYAAVGTSVAIVYLAAYTSLRAAGFNSRGLANAIAYALAIVWQYLFQASFTFRRDVRDRAQVARFIVSTAACFSISHMLVGYGSTYGLVSEWVALVVTVAVLPVVNFLFLTLWVFSAKASRKQ